MTTFLSTLCAYSLTLVSSIPNVSTTEAMFTASPCKYPSINPAKLFCIESVAPSNCERSAGSKLCFWCDGGGYWGEADSVVGAVEC